MAENKVQVVCVVDPSVRDRLDQVRLIRGVSRARVTEEAIIAGLQVIEHGQAKNLARVLGLTQRAGMKWVEYIRRYAELYRSNSVGPGLDALEQDDSAITGRRVLKPRPVDFSHAIPLAE